MTPRSRTALLVATALVVTAPSFLRAQEPSAGERHPAPQDSVPADPCSPDAIRDEAWVDWVHEKIHRTVCGSALWFDSFFGEERVDEERDQTFVRAGAGVVWDDREGWGGDYRFRAKISFPNLEDRVNVVLGRGPLDAILTGESESAVDPPPLAEDPDDEATWLLGLGFVPLRQGRNRLGFDVGVRLQWPPDPYVRASYRLHAPLSGFALVRFRQTAFWEGVEGLGTTSRLDLDRVLGSRFLLRLRGAGTISELAEGLRWNAGLQLYQHLGDAGALRWEGTLLGETEREVPLRDARLRLAWRTRVARDWLFVETRIGVHWPRDEPAEKRRATPEAGIGLEIASGPLGRSWFW